MGVIKLYEGTEISVVYDSESDSIGSAVDRVEIFPVERDDSVTGVWVYISDGNDNYSILCVIHTGWDGFCI